jgi:hypothetical protein
MPRTVSPRIQELYPRIQARVFEKSGASVLLRYTPEQFSYGGLPSTDMVLRIAASTKVRGPGQPDRLAEVRYVPPSSLEVMFADGGRGTIEVHNLGLDPADFDLETVRINDTGTAVEVLTDDGGFISVDSSVVRAEADPEYAARLQRLVDQFAFPERYLEQLAQTHRPPDSWCEDEDLPF